MQNRENQARTNFWFCLGHMSLGHTNLFEQQSLYTVSNQKKYVK